MPYAQLADLPSGNERSEAHLESLEDCALPEWVPFDMRVSDPGLVVEVEVDGRRRRVHPLVEGVQRECE